MGKIDRIWVLDKSHLPDGEWQNESDKIQWIDYDTNLPCVIVRTDLGHWCGYVGVLEGHSLFGIDYSECPISCTESLCYHKPESRLDVHGGITFSGLNKEPYIAEFTAWRVAFKKWEKEAEKYPEGEAALRVKQQGGFYNDFDAWFEYNNSRSNSWVPNEKPIWWFGFDCAHVNDLVPAMGRLLRSTYPIDVTYRNTKYVVAECEMLAKQLNEIK